MVLCLAKKKLEKTLIKEVVSEGLELVYEYFKKVFKSSIPLVQFSYFIDYLNACYDVLRSFKVKINIKNTKNDINRALNSELFIAKEVFQTAENKNYFIFVLLQSGIPEFYTYSIRNMQNQNKLTKYDEFIKLIKNDDNYNKKYIQILKEIINKIINKDEDAIIKRPSSDH